MAVGTISTSFSRDAILSPKSSPIRPPPEQIRILVGPEQHQFRVDRHLLSASCPFFREQLRTTYPSLRESSSSSSSSDEDNDVRRPSARRCLWLPTESPAMFDLFLTWLRHRTGFAAHLASAVDMAASGSSDEAAAHRLQWSLVRVHLFASQLGLRQLQDASMDAIQDLYLRLGWDIAPRFVRFLYGQCDAAASVRLRKWTVAMVAFSIAGGSQATKKTTEYDLATTAADIPIMLINEPGTGSHCRQDSVDDIWPPSLSSSPGDDRPAPIASLRKKAQAAGGGSSGLEELLDRYPDFAADLAVHESKMLTSGLDAGVKNPALRVRANRLRNDQRHYGFRQCSFHSHRAAVGERRCPHDVAIEPLVPKKLDHAPAPPLKTTAEEMSAPAASLLLPSLMEQIEKHQRQLHHRRHVDALTLATRHERRRGVWDPPYAHELMPQPLRRFGSMKV